MRKEDLENRLIEFSLQIVNVVESLPTTKTGNHLGGQLIRSGTSPSLNYAEAQGAESRNDFIHKMKICLKELRETLVLLKILIRTNLILDKNDIELLIKENDELISIFVKSILTAQNNKRNLKS